MDCYFQGRRYREKVGEKEDARERYRDLANLNRRARRGEDVTAPGPVANMPTFGEALAGFLPTVQAHKSARDYVRCGKMFGRAWGAERLDAITPALVEAWKSTRLGAGLKPASVNRELAFLKRCFNFTLLNLEASPATRHLAAKLTNPVKHVRFPKANNKRDRYLSRAEEAELVPHLPRPLYLALLVAVETGIRQANLFGMARAWIDWERRTVTLPETKDGYKQVVFLSRLAYRALREQCDSHKLPWVWPGQKQKGPVNVGWVYNKLWLPAVKAAGIPPITWHDLKHTTAQRLLEEGGQDLFTVQKVLNLKDPTTTQRYSTLSEKHLRRAVDSPTARLRKASKAIRRQIAAKRAKAKVGRLAALLTGRTESGILEPDSSD